MAERFIPDSKFENRGYTRFDPSGTHYANRAYQKRFMDNDTTLYFLNCYQYEYPGSDFPKSTMVESHFYLPGREEEWVTVEMHYCGDLDFAEKFFSDVYHKLGMIPNRHNQ